MNLKMERRTNELMEKVRRKTANTEELKELKDILEKRMKEYEEEGECDKALSLSVLLVMVDNFLQKKK